MTDVVKQLSNALSSAVDAAAPSVLRVEGRRRGPASGVAWSEDGVVVTASHALEIEEGIEIGLADGSTARADLVGRDPGTDLAVLRVSGTKLTPARFVDLDDKKVGELVLAIGRPGRTVRAALGVLSGLADAWRTPSGGRVERFLQSDVGLERAYSGSLLVDGSGAALGVNTGGLLRGSGVTLPAVTLRRVVDAIVAHGRVRRGWLGVGAYPVRLPGALAGELGQRPGLIVLAVHEKSPAADAGLLLGDVLLGIGGEPTGHLGELQALLDEERIGQTLEARVLRAGKPQAVPITIGARP